MKRATSPLRRFAQRLLDAETAGSAENAAAAAAFLVCEKLRPHLSALMGTAGFHALLARALALASREMPRMRALQLAADGSLSGLEELEAQLGPKGFAESGEVLLEQLLELLAAFVGEHLTIRVVSQAWPKVPLDDLGFGKGDKNEKEK